MGQLEQVLRSWSHSVASFLESTELTFTSEQGQVLVGCGTKLLGKDRGNRCHGLCGK